MCEYMVLRDLGLYPALSWPIPSRRALIWDDLRALQASIAKPWLCIIDFNEVTSSQEKFWGNRVNSGRVEVFQSFISDWGLIDLKYKGINHTWSNKRCSGHNIQARLGRALANVDWRTKFPLAQVFHEVILGSYHAPVVLKCCHPLKKVPRSFKFESKWTTFGWPRKQGSHMLTRNQKLKQSKRGLKNWSKIEFGSHRARTARLKGWAGKVALRISFRGQFCQIRGQ